MRWDVFAWGAAALLLFAAEALAPGAFMLWLGFAATVVFVVVLLVPGIPLLAQVAAFVVLSFVSIQIYRTWFRGKRARERPADAQPPRRAAGRARRAAGARASSTAVAGCRSPTRCGTSTARICRPERRCGSSVSTA